MKMCLRFHAVALFALVLLGARHARAQLKVYDDSTLYAAATAGNTNYTPPAPGGGNNQEVSSPYTIGPLSFRGAELFLYDDGNYGSGVNYAGARVVREVML